MKCKLKLNNNVGLDSCLECEHIYDKDVCILLQHKDIIKLAYKDAKEIKNIEVRKIVKERLIKNFKETLRLMRKTPIPILLAGLMGYMQIANIHIPARARTVRTSRTSRTRKD